ncbi:unnamed protein product [Clavelina lepadiformis]|uniref:Uncharacterized protein n=1 Tax=Clavelina lepadiformis TaxID=159417 RepID=A0ABP0FJL8_CLALP
MVLTYADRVKRQGIWSFDLPKDYNREREVSVKFKTALKRQEIYEVLRKARIPLLSLEGVVQCPGQQVELAFNSKNTAVKMAQALRSVPNVQSAIAQGDEFTNITVAWVPINFPPHAIDQFVAKIGPFSKAKIGTDRLQQKKDGRRIYTVKREDLIKARPPSFIYFGHYRFLIEYEGQAKTCESSSHSTTDGIKFSQSRHSDADTEELAPTPAESLLERYRQPQHSTPTAKKHDKGNATAKPKIDYYDEFMIETTAPKGDSDTPQPNRETNLLRKKITKRRIRTPNNSSDEKPPHQKQKEDEDYETNSTDSDDEYPQTQKPQEDGLEEERTYNENTNNYSEQIYEGEIVCSCNETLQQPGCNEIIQCTNCSKVYYLCHCPDNNLRGTHRFKQQTCETCDYTYVPDNLKLNATANV